jgi:hypothetical protein
MTIKAIDLVSGELIASYAELTPAAVSSIIGDVA